MAQEPSAPSAEQRPRRTRYTPEQISEADSRIDRAFAILGLVGDGNLACPICRTSKRGKVKIKVSNGTQKPYWRCHKCPDPGEGSNRRPWGGSAIDLMRNYGGRNFPTAVAELLGEGPSGEVATPLKGITISPSFRAVVDVEIYDRIRDAGSYELAGDYYGPWHISPEAVRSVGATLIQDPNNLQSQLLEEFGEARLVEAGVITSNREGQAIFLFSEDYNVVEPHTAPSGHVVGMQFRPSPERLKEVVAHKEWKKAWSGRQDEDGNELEAAEVWRKAYASDRNVGRRKPYVTPFLSLRGGGSDHLVGGGLHLIYKLPPGSDVYVVEGIKDLMAARTMGVDAYAIPGANVIPPDGALEVLKKHRIRVMLDGDAAGAQGRDSLVRDLVARGLNAEPADILSDGKDVTDILVERNAHAGCGCRTCTSWRERFPWDALSCGCRSCREARITAG